MNRNVGMVSSGGAKYDLQVYRYVSVKQRGIQVLLRPQSIGDNGVLAITKAFIDANLYRGNAVTSKGCNWRYISCGGEAFGVCLYPA